MNEISVENRAYAGHVTNDSGKVYSLRKSGLDMLG